MDSVGCNHEELTPVNLADRVPTNAVKKWPRNVRLGWDVFCLMLQHSESMFSTGNTSDDDDDDEEDDEDFDEPCHHYMKGHLRDIFSRTDEKIRQLHAVVQTEYLTYRRIREGDPWLSPNFNMLDVYKSLQPGNGISLTLWACGMMTPVCICGNFQSALDDTPRAEDVMRYHFSNLEDWSRTTFLPIIEFRPC